MLQKETYRKQCEKGRKKLMLIMNPKKRPLENNLGKGENDYNDLKKQRPIENNLEKGENTDNDSIRRPLVSNVEKGES